MKYLSGQIAAQALLDGRFEMRRVEQVYNSQLAKVILPKLRLGRILAKLIYDYPRIRTWLFRLYGRKLSEVVTDVFIGEKTYCGMLHSPLNYLKLGWVLRGKTQRLFTFTHPLIPSWRGLLKFPS